MNYPKTSFYSTLNTPVKNYSFDDIRYELEFKAEGNEKLKGFEPLKEKGRSVEV